MIEYNVKITDDGYIYINGNLHSFYCNVDSDRCDDLNKKALIALADAMGYESVFLFEEIADDLNRLVDDEDDF